MASHYRRWDKEDDNFLWENYVRLGAKECSKRMRRSYGSIVARYAKLYNGTKKEKKK